MSGWGGWRVASCCLVVAGLLAGCGDGRPKRYPVSGRVLIDGQPLEVGFIRLIADDARPSYGHLGPGGRFALTCYEGKDGSVPGTHRVVVTAVGLLEDGQSRRWFAPKKYADPSTTDVTVSIDGPTDSLEINLTWDGGAPFVERD